MSLSRRLRLGLTFRSLVPLGLAASVVVSGAAAEEEAVPAALTGTVVDPDGVPVADARVWTTDTDREPVEARTDDAGRFRLGPLAPACRPGALVFVEAEGFARQYVRDGATSRFPGVDHDLGAIRLDPGRMFTGRVLDPDGTPRAGATVGVSVRVHSLGHTVWRLGPEWTVQTDAEGRFRSPRLPVGHLAVSVKVPGRKVGLATAPVCPADGEEELEPIRLEEDTPIAGVVTDDMGTPIAGATVTTYAGYEPVETDASGSFTLRTLPPRDRFPLRVRKDGYVMVSRMVSVADAGFSWHEQAPDGSYTSVGPVADLAVTMQPVSWIEGRAIDAETGEPVRLSSVVLCFFERKADGEVVLNGCRVAEFSQPEPGRFRVTYAVPDEYHLALSAEGYHDAEAFTPKVDTLRPVEGITVEMTRKAEGTTGGVATPRIVGVATRDGRPVATGWAGVGKVPQGTDSVNAFIQRGRTVTGAFNLYRGVPIGEGGVFELEVPYQDDRWFVLVEEPGHAPTVVGPIAVASGEWKRLEVACVAGGSIAGRVADVPEADRGPLWVVAFSEDGTRAEARVEADGTFSLRDLPPGRYGLKVGHDAFEDAEVPRGAEIPPEAYERPATPWGRAKVVAVEAGAPVADVVLPAPERPDRLESAGEMP